MIWKIEFESKAAKHFEKLDKTIQKRIGVEIDKIAQIKNPRDYGKSLKGNLSGLWRYRAGDYRILCKIYDDKLLILVLDVDHRKNIYKE